MENDDAKEVGCQGASLELKMNRWLSCAICVLLAELMVLGGWLASAHLRAIEPVVLERAGRGTPGLIDCGLKLAADGNDSAARLICQAAKEQNIPEVAKIEPLAGPATPGNLTDFQIQSSNRETALRVLGESSLPGVQALLQCRALTNTVIFPPSSSGAGQAFDASICIAGLLEKDGKLMPALQNNLTKLADGANRGGNSQPLEEALMDFMSLGERLDWGQLSAMVEHIIDVQTLHQLTSAARNDGNQLPTLFAAVALTGKPGAVSDYLTHYSQTGMADLGASLRYGAGGEDELLRSDQRLYISTGRERLAAHAPWAGLIGASTELRLWSPRLAFVVKCLFYLTGGFFLALVIHFALPEPAVSQPLPVRGLYLARGAIFALGFLFVVLLLSEPFLAGENQKTDATFRLRLPSIGSVVPARTPAADRSLMNTINLLTLLLFFVLQALLYVASLVKLTEIRHVRVLPRVKLRLLENEEHLFDAGLYLGFVGTIISLILVSLGVIKPSLMAAYSSTSFGIIFVSIFKIFHLRPAKRTMLLQAEAEADVGTAASESTAPTVSAPAYATP
jgi:hypothetical protein